MKLTTSIIIFFLAVMALVAEFILGAIFSIGTGFLNGSSSVGTVATVFGVLMIMTLAAGILAPLSAFIGMFSKNYKLSRQLYGGSLAFIFIILLTLNLTNFKTTSNTSQQANSTITSQKSAPNQEKKQQEVDLKILDKNFKEIDFNAGNYQNQIAMKFEFRSNTSKPVKAVKGVVTFYDAFGDKIKSTELKYDEGIAAFGVEQYDGVMDYNQFIDSDNQLKDIALENLKYDWQVEQVIYK